VLAEDGIEMGTYAATLVHCQRDKALCSGGLKWLVVVKVLCELVVLCLSKSEIRA
jgi:hypothetical protein